MPGIYWLRCKCSILT